MIFFCGNGASATMAEHMSHDWFQNAGVNTYTCSETSHITAISNDVSYADVFAYRIERVLTEKDILVTISSSGNSPNVIRAIEEARKKGAFIITVSGKDGGNQSRKLGDLNFYVPLDTYGLVESAHAVLLHIIPPFSCTARARSTHTCTPSSKGSSYSRPVTVVRSNPSATSEK